MFCFTFLKISVEISRGEPQRCEERPKMSEKRRQLCEHRFRDARWAKMGQDAARLGQYGAEMAQDRGNTFFEAVFLAFVRASKNIT